MLAAGDALVDVLPPACAAADARAVAETVARELPRGRGELWRLERVPAGSPWPAAVAAAGRTRLRWRDEPRSWSPTCATPAPHGRPSAARRRAAAPPARRRARGHRPRPATGRRRRAATSGSCCGCTRRAGARAASRRQSSAFHADFAARAAERGWLASTTLEVTPAGRGAVRLAARDGAFAYSQAFDPPMRATPSASRCWPRRSSSAAAEGCTRFDMLRGESATSSASASARPAGVASSRGAAPPLRWRRLRARRPARTWARLPAGGRRRLGRLRAGSPAAAARSAADRAPTDRRPTACRRRRPGSPPPVRRGVRTAGSAPGRHARRDEGGHVGHDEARRAGAATASAATGRWNVRATSALWSPNCRSVPSANRPRRP